MKILKRYKDEEKWFPITEETARHYLAQDYSCVDGRIRDIEDGHTVYTPFAIYRKGDLECLPEETG